ncbi:MAG: HEAT repeat domain-containing protein, partial [Bacteroidota bacterium]
TEIKNENYLITLLDNIDKIDDIKYIVRSLGYIGTNKSVELLISYLKHKSQNIRYESLNTLPTIMLREGYTYEEIKKKTNVSDNYLDIRKERLKTLSRP